MHFGSFKMNTSDESTTGSEGYGEGERQSIVDMYVTVALQCIINDPWASIPAVLRTLAGVGPAGSREEIIELFGAESVFKTTIRRLDIIRVAVIRGALNTLPITTMPTPGGMVGHTMPENDGFIRRWAPVVEGDQPAFVFRIMACQEERLNRYPHDGDQTEDGLRDENMSDSSDA